MGSAEISAQPARGRTAREKEILAERVRERVEASGRSPRDVSIAASGKPDMVRDIYRLRSMPSGPNLHALAEALGTTTDWLLGKADTPVQPVSEVSFRDAPRAFRHDSPGPMPVLGTGYCDDLAVEGEDGEPLKVERVLLDVDHTVQLIERPPALWNAKDAYAIYCHGNSMEPKFEQGDLAVVDPRRPPSPGDYVVVQLNDGDGEDVVTVLVKRLVKATSAEVVLEQFNPRLTFRVPRRQVARLHRICQTNELWNV